MAGLIQWHYPPTKPRPNSIRDGCTTPTYNVFTGSVLPSVQKGVLTTSHCTTHTGRRCQNHLRKARRVTHAELTDKYNSNWRWCIACPVKKHFVLRPKCCRVFRAGTSQRKRRTLQYRTVLCVGYNTWQDVQRFTISCLTYLAMPHHAVPM